MAVYDIYSKRDQLGKEPDVYTYELLPERLRVQIHHIITGAIGKFSGGFRDFDEVEDSYATVRKILLKEYGKFFLHRADLNPEKDVLYFLLKSDDVKRVLDVIELCFRMFSMIRSPKIYQQTYNTELLPEQAIAELNARFKENGVGYVFEFDRIIRIDSNLTHTEITKPTLQLLSNPRFANANEEYLKAHDHYRHGRNKEAIVDALKAFESTLKIIVKNKGWEYNEKDTASKLIQKCFENALAPAYLQEQFTSLRKMFESGAPIIRNNVGGHGQGHEKKEAPDQLVRYALNLTGSNIIFLVELSGLK